MSTRPPTGGQVVGYGESMFDELRDTARHALEGHEEQVKDGLDKVGDFIDDKTDNKYGDQIDKGVDIVQDGLDKFLK